MALIFCSLYALSCAFRVHSTIAAPLNVSSAHWVKDCKGLLPGVYSILTAKCLCAQVPSVEHNWHFLHTQLLWCPCKHLLNSRGQALIRFVGVYLHFTCCLPTVDQPGLFQSEVIYWHSRGQMVLISVKLYFWTNEFTSRWDFFWNSFGTTHLWTIGTIPFLNTWRQ